MRNYQNIQIGQQVDAVQSGYQEPNAGAHIHRSHSIGLLQRPEILAAGALLLLYLALSPGHLQSIDGLLIFKQGESLAFNHSVRFSSPVWWGAPSFLSKYGIGYSLLYVPGLMVWSWLLPYTPVYHGIAYDFNQFYADPLYTIAGAPLNAMVTTCSAYLVSRFIRALGFGTTPALWGLVLFGIASPAIVYSRGDWAQPLEGLCWIAALYAMLRFRSTSSSRYLWICGVSVAYALLTRPVEGILLLPALLLIMYPGLRFWRARRAFWHACYTVIGAVVVGGAITGLVNWARFGSPLTTGYGGETWTFDFAHGLPGILISPAHGILLAFPAFLLAPLGFAALWQRGWRLAGLALGLLVVLQILNVAAWDQWWGGWNWGPRLLVPALPLMAILAVCGISTLPAMLRSWLPYLLLAGGVIWAVPCILCDLLAGYAGSVANGTTNTFAAIFNWHWYPPIGAWGWTHYLRARVPTDSGGIDIVWFRSIYASHYASLVPFILLLGGALVLSLRARQLCDTISIPNASVIPTRDAVTARRER